jgi:drug/metabolite transporter (DMT)-like permease
MQESEKSYLFLAAAVFFWSWIGVIGKYLYAYGMPPLTAVVFRALFAWGLLLPVMLSSPERLRIPRGKLPGLALYGLVAVAVNYLGYFYALKYLPVAAAVVLIYTNPAFVVLLSWPVLGERPTKGELVALLLTLGGVFLVAQGYAPGKLVLNWKGVLFALTTASAIAAYNLAGKRYVRELDPWTVMSYGLLFGGALLASWWLVTRDRTLAYPLPAWGLVLVLGLFPTLLGYGLYLRALRHLRAGHAAIAATAEPFLAALWAMSLLGERLEPPQILGGLLVLGTAWGLQFRSR